MCCLSKWWIVLLLQGLLRDWCKPLNVEGYTSICSAQSWGTIWLRGQVPAMFWFQTTQNSQQNQAFTQAPHNHHVKEPLGLLSRGQRTQRAHFQHHHTVVIKQLYNEVDHAGVTQHHQSQSRLWSQHLSPPSATRTIKPFYLFSFPWNSRCQHKQNIPRTSLLIIEQTATKATPGPCAEQGWGCAGPHRPSLAWWHLGTRREHQGPMETWAWRAGRAGQETKGTRQSTSCQLSYSWKNVFSRALSKYSEE